MVLLSWPGFFKDNKMKGGPYKIRIAGPYKTTKWKAVLATRIGGPYKTTKRNGGPYNTNMRSLQHK